jgi:DNA-binding CsgD family transcriptional regulator
MERCLGLVASISPENEMFSAFAWGARGMREMFHGDRRVAVEHLGRSVDMLAGLPYAEPAAFRAVWPLLLAAVDDRRAKGASEDARRFGLDAFSLNKGLISCAAAIIVGRAGDKSAARRAVGASESHFVNSMAWNDIARWLVAESAAAMGWDDPAWWVSGVGERLAALGLAHPAERCRRLADAPRRWEGFGITAREADVLNLVVQGLSNKEIAATLSLSSRTVEKHVEALLRKLDARSRTHLAAVAEAWRRPHT